MSEFSDDEFDALASDDLQALEEDAEDISQPTTRYTNKDYAHGLTNLHEGSVDSLEYDLLGPGLQQTTTTTPAPHYTQPYQIVTHSTENHNSQAEVVGESAQREQFRQQRYGQTTPGLIRAASGGNLVLPHRTPAQNTYRVEDQNIPISNEEKSDFLKLQAELNQASDISRRVEYFVTLASFELRTRIYRQRFNQPTINFSQRQGKYRSLGLIRTKQLKSMKGVLQNFRSSINWIL
jgi:hypothetical protein